MDHSPFLRDSLIPLRLSAIDQDGFPVICSLWYLYHDDALYCVSHRNAKIIRLLKARPECGFEIAVNGIPYRGVRGKAIASLSSDSEGVLLSKLIDRYLGGSNQALADWLMSRKADEIAICLRPKTLSSWDFSERMSDD